MNNNKIVAVALLVIAIAFALIGMFGGCRSVKRQSQKIYTQYDSTNSRKSSAVKETLVTERIDSSFFFNPGDFAGYFNSRDTSEQIFSTDAYEVSVKPGSGGKGRVSVKGKDQKKDVSFSRSVATKEISQEREDNSVAKKTVVRELAKKSTAIPVWVFVLFGVAVAAAALYLLRRYGIKMRDSR